MGAGNTGQAVDRACRVPLIEAGYDGQIHGFFAMATMLDDGRHAVEARVAGLDHRTRFIVDACDGLDPYLGGGSQSVVQEHREELVVLGEN